MKSVENHQITFIRAGLVAIVLAAVALINLFLVETDLLLLGCFGAAAVLVSIEPNSYLARPWNISVGIILSSAIGLLAASFVSHTPTALVIAGATAMLAMSLLKAEHPPGGAAALIAAAGGYEFSYLLFPIASGTLAVIGVRYISAYVHKHFLMEAKTGFLSVDATSLDVDTLAGDIQELFVLLNNVSDLPQKEENLEKALEGVLRELCALTRWPIGHAYVVDQTGQNVASSSKVWFLDESLDKSEIRAFIEQSENSTFEVGQGMIGAVMKDARPVAIPDVTVLDGFVRAQSARTNNVKGAFAFPVVYEGDTKIILEFFSREEAELDSDTLEILQFVGKQICFVLSTLDHRADFEKLAGNFENGVKSIVQNTEKSIAVLREATKKLSGGVTTSLENADKGRLSASKTSENVQDMAHSVDEMSSAIREIAERVEEATRLTHLCDEKMKNADEKSVQLEKAAGKVNAALDFINEIAEQTNLLALNATIEAARAGEHGKGFTIVAGEVKSLASQSAKTVDEIAAIINGMMGATSEITESLHEISAAVKEINHSSTAISSAVTEQSSVTDGIAENMKNTAGSSSNVSDMLVGIHSSVEDTNVAAMEVEDETKSLREQAAELTGQVDNFLRSVRRRA